MAKITNEQKLYVLLKYKKERTKEDEKNTFCIRRKS